MLRQEFHAAILSGRGYVTPAGGMASPLARRLGRYDLYYYLRVLRAFHHSARKVRDGWLSLDNWADVSFDLMRCAEACGGRVTVTVDAGLLASDRPRVYVANHMSMLETFLLPGILISFGGLAIVLKRSLMSYPLLGAILGGVDPIVVDRRNPREDLKTVLEKGVACLANGRSVLIFPQSTRSLVFDPTEFNTLGVKLARQAGVSVAPIAVKTDFLGIGRRFRDFGPLHRQEPIRLALGPVYDVVGNGAEAQRQAVAFIRAHLTDWGVPVHEKSGGAGEAA